LAGTLGVIFHAILFGKSFDEVNNAVMYQGMSVNPTFDPGTLQPGTTYYWRVDEFTGATTYKGNVWSFTTVPSVPVTDSHLLGG
jgi:hypothetical protein